MSSPINLNNNQNLQHVYHFSCGTLFDKHALPDSVLITGLSRWLEDLFQDRRANEAAKRSAWLSLPYLSCLQLPLLISCPP